MRGNSSSGRGGRAAVPAPGQPHPQPDQPVEARAAAHHATTGAPPATEDLTGLATALRHSWAQLERLGDHAAAYFYATLFTLDPSLREMFPAAMGGQRDRLLAALGHIVSHVDDGPTLSRFLAQLGRDHRRFDVRPEHYPLVGRALLHTLAQGLGPAWTAELADQWSRAYDLVSWHMIEAAAASAQREPARWDAEIVGHERRTGDIAVITARIAGSYHWRAGQSIAVESHLRPRVWRYLSPANPPRRDGTVEFHVRAVAGGQLSPALVYQAQAGDLLQLSAPIGERLTVPPGDGSDLLLLAGGTGLAPLRAVAEELAQAGDRRQLRLIAGAAYRYELYDLDALTGLAQHHQRLTVRAALSGDPALGPPQTVAEAAAADGDWHDRLIYICGSPGMVDATRHALLGQGCRPEQLRTEQYDGSTYAPLQLWHGADQGPV